MAVYSKPRGVLPMLFALFVLLQVTVAAHHGGHQHAHRQLSQPEAEIAEKMALLEERQSNGRVKVTGVLGPTRGERKEIRDLRNNADQWNLYLLGMERFMAKDKNDVLSYYQIAGIHGRPYTTWNGFGPLVHDAGFCPHGHALFGSWHRPYLAVFEQAWYKCVEEVVATFPSDQQARWTNARQGLRIPYWDWAVDPGNGNSNIPTLIRDQYVTVTKPQGQVSIPNPLYSYTFPGGSLPPEMGGGPWNNWPTTLRRPVANPTRSNNNEVSSQLQNMRVSLRDRIYYLFLSKASWGYVSTEQIGARVQDGSTDSFESIHDAIHVTVGGDMGGTMYFLDYSAFDPIFWLHHCNIDRLLAMYQRNSPDTWVATANINRDMAQWSTGESKNSNTPLKPFPNNAQTGSYYTSNDVRDTLLLGYYYADATSQSAMVNAVNSKYSGGRNGLNKRDGKPYDGRPLKEGDYHTVLSIVADKYAFDGSYTVHCYLGNHNTTTNTTAPYGNSTAPYGNTTAPYSNTTSPYYTPPTTNSTTGPHDYTSDPNYVGSYGILGGSHKGNTQLTESCIPLTTALQGKEAAGYIKSIAPEDCEDYLATNLYYKIVGPGGVEYEADQVPNFHVYVQSAPIHPAPAGELPSLGTYVKLPKATENKPAGKPYTWQPGPYDYIGYNETPSYEYPAPASAYPSGYPVPTAYPSGYPVPTGSPTSPNYPAGTMVFPKPEDEAGYCVSHQTIVYVDNKGQYLNTEHY